MKLFTPNTLTRSLLGCESVQSSFRSSALQHGAYELISSLRQILPSRAKLGGFHFVNWLMVISYFPTHLKFHVGDVVQDIFMLSQSLGALFIDPHWGQGRRGHYDALKLSIILGASALCFCEPHKQGTTFCMMVRMQRERERAC